MNFTVGKEYIDPYYKNIKNPPIYKCFYVTPKGSGVCISSISEQEHLFKLPCSFIEWPLPPQQWKALLQAEEQPYLSSKTYSSAKEVRKDYESSSFPKFIKAIRIDQ